MTVTQVIGHFGSISETASNLKISYQAVQQWVDANKIPKGRQYEIEVKTGGALVAEAAA